MSTEYMLGFRWIVWVGGVDDYYTHYETDEDAETDDNTLCFKKSEVEEITQ